MRLYGIGSLEGPTPNFREDGGAQAGGRTCSRGEGPAVTDDDNVTFCGEGLRIGTPLSP